MLCLRDPCWVVLGGGGRSAFGEWDGGVVGGGGFEILLVDFRLFAGEEGRRGGRGELRI